MPLLHPVHSPLLLPCTTAAAIHRPCAFCSLPFLLLPSLARRPSHAAHPQVTLEPYERDHAVVVGVYRPQKKKEQ